jgi:hypothetical protein
MSIVCPSPLASTLCGFPIGDGLQPHWQGPHEVHQILRLPKSRSKLDFTVKVAVS